ncbi:hypothetical protein MKX03_021943 [Papaver bracteatum]|nr:hypothetical protein MKX03_021943 [Papaver bracteatum]
MDEVHRQIENQQEPPQKIYKVRTHVKHRNSTAYQPKLVSIGPYHYGLPQLRPMEKDKRRAQDKLVEKYKVTIDEYKVEMKKIVKTVKNECGHAISCNPVTQDLLMAENQLPYLVLENLLKTSGKDPSVISQWIRSGVQDRGFNVLETYMGGLLELGARSMQPREVGKYASEHYQFNVNFIKAGNYTSMQFNNGNGTLSLPVLTINEYITSTYLNMNAQALNQESLTTNVFTVYASLMGTLVKLSKDVRLLEYRGIIINELRNHEAAVEVIQDIAKGTFVSYDVTDGKGLSYKSVQNDLEKFCQKKDNKLKRTLWLWLSELYETHFKNPWTALGHSME